MLDFQKDHRLTPEDLLLEERTALKIKKEREEANEAYSQQCAVEEALESNPNLDLERASVRGKRVNGPNSKPRNNSANPKDVGYVAALLAACNGPSIQKIYEQFQSLAFFFQEAQKASVAGAALSGPKLVENDDYIFDTAQVSLKTIMALEAEASVLNTRVLALASIKEPTALRVEMENIRKEAERLNMVQHPETNLYIHSEARVIALEMINNPHDDAKLCTHAICVFRPKMHGIDSVGIHRKGLGDVYNNDVAEAIVTGQHIAPEFKHS